MDISQLTKIVAQPETPKQIEIGASKFSRARASAPSSATLPTFLPGEISLTPYELPASNLQTDEPKYGLIEPLMKDPALRYEASPIEPGNVPLPDLAMNQSGSSNYYPPTSLPTPQTHGGLDYKSGGGAINGPSTDLPGYGIGSGNGTGRGNGTGTADGTGSDPLGELPGLGSGNGNGIGNVNSTAQVPGVGGSGDRYVASTQTDQPATEKKKPVIEDIFSEPELSGLLKWLRGQNTRFPEVVQTFLETHPGDLCSIAKYEGWDIFIQFSENAHQLKIFLTKGSTGILLADSDFRSRSQLFGTGRVSRAASGITAIESVREKPTLERTDEFYRVFQDWLQSLSISMGSRRAQ